MWLIFISDVDLETIAVHVRWHEKGDDASIQFGPNQILKLMFLYSHALC